MMARKSERLSGSDERVGRRWRLNAYTLFSFTSNDKKSVSLGFMVQRCLPAAVVTLVNGQLQIARVH